MYKGGVVDILSLNFLKNIFNIHKPKKQIKIYTALEIANYIVNKCYYENKSISNPQLQRVLYFLQMRFLKLKCCPYVLA